MTPTIEQQNIIAAAKSPASIMVNALAGTGKTTTLTLLATALPSKPSLALAFNVKIKKELEKRFPPNFTVLTMNGLGHKAWSFTIRKNKMFLDEKKLGRITTEALKPFPSSKGAWNDIRQLVVYAMQKGLVPSQFQHAHSLVPDTPDNWQQIAQERDLDLTSEECKLSRRILIESIEEGFAAKISFDDQIYLPTVFKGAFPKFEMVLVDEAQDLSPLNHEMLRLCASGRLVVVGDPRQAIYAFRGADSSSMSNIRALREDWIELPLNTTFRCPQSVVARQWNHAPQYVAAPSNPQGLIRDLTSQTPGASSSWTWDDIPSGDCAVLCRNNAPLVTMAFKLIRRGIGVNMLGRDIGRGLSSLCKKLSPDQSIPLPAAMTLLSEWYAREFSVAEANKDNNKMDSLTDRFECVQAVAQNKNPATLKNLIAELDNLFANDSGRVTLATGHKSKGLEWDVVVHLDPWRVPSKFAKSPAEIQQEHNLRYVLETRTKHTLVLANLSDFEQA